jgi:hypothetical protein
MSSVQYQSRRVFLGVRAPQASTAWVRGVFGRKIHKSFRPRHLSKAADDIFKRDDALQKLVIGLQKLEDGIWKCDDALRKLADALQK